MPDSKRNMLTRPDQASAPRLAPPVGPFYAAFLGSMDLNTFNRLLDFVLKTKLVRRDGDLLVWVG